DDRSGSARLVRPDQVEPLRRTLDVVGEDDEVLQLASPVADVVGEQRLGAEAEAVEQRYRALLDGDDLDDELAEPELDSGLQRVQDELATGSCLRHAVASAVSNLSLRFCRNSAIVGMVTLAAAFPTASPMCPACRRSSSLSRDPTRSISGAAASTGTMWSR